LAGFCPERRWVAGDYTPSGGGIASDSVEPHYDSGPCKQALKIPAHFHIRCFNCLSLSHCVATCQVRQRCLRCRGLGHIARDCCRPKATLNGGGQPRHARTDHCQPSQRASLDGTPAAYGTKMGVEGCPWRPLAARDDDVVAAVVSRLWSSPRTSHPPPPMSPVLRLASLSPTLWWRRSASTPMPPFAP